MKTLGLLEAAVFVRQQHQREKMKGIANRDAREYVARKEPFVGSNLYARKNDGDGSYIVYSYRDSWPLFVFDGHWYENQDRFSRSTSRHRRQAHPLVDTVPLNHDAIYTLSQIGEKKFLARVLQGTI